MQLIQCPKSHFCNFPLDPCPRVEECGSMWVHVGRRVIWVGICPVKYGKRGIWTLGLELMWPCQSCQREKQKPCGNIWRRSSSRLFTSIIQPTHATLFWSQANDFAFSSWSNNGGVGGEGVFVGGKQTRIPDIQSKTSAFLRFPPNCTALTKMIRFYTFYLMFWWYAGDHLTFVPRLWDISCCPRPSPPPLPW